MLLRFSLTFSIWASVKKLRSPRAVRIKILMILFQKVTTSSTPVPRCQLSRDASLLHAGDAKVSGDNLPIQVGTASLGVLTQLGTSSRGRRSSGARFAVSAIMLASGNSFILGSGRFALLLTLRHPLASVPGCAPLARVIATFCLRPFLPNTTASLRSLSSSILQAPGLARDPRSHPATCRRRVYLQTWPSLTGLSDRSARPSALPLPILTPSSLQMYWSSRALRSLASCMHPWPAGCARPWCPSSPIEAAGPAPVTVERYLPAPIFHMPQMSVKCLAGPSRILTVLSARWRCVCSARAEQTCYPRESKATTRTKPGTTSTMRQKRLNKKRHDDAGPPLLRHPQAKAVQAWVPSGCSWMGWARP